MGKKAETWAQLQAQSAAETFKDRILLIVRLATEKVEKMLWDQVNSMPIEVVREEVDGWISNTNSMAGRASAHDRLDPRIASRKEFDRASLCSNQTLSE